MPTLSKSNKRKRREYEDQQRYDYPERHPKSDHPESHFHDRYKRKAKVNRHHTYPD
jgi:hypothetical protein